MTKAKSRMARHAFTLVVAALVVWVLVATVPWSDRLLLQATLDGEITEVSGTLLTEWQAEQVEFAPDGSASLDGGPDGLLAGATKLHAHPGGIQVGGEAHSYHSVEWRPGLPRVFRELNLGALVPAVILLFVCSLLVITRWAILLGAANCPTRWSRVFRVTYVGLFFNLILPGMSGGDIARAYLMVKGHPEQRAAALTSVFMDRLLGLLAMAMLATLAIFLNDERFESLRLPVLAVASAMAGGLFVMIHPWMRKHLPLWRIIDRLPGKDAFHSLDKALRHYGTRPGVVCVAILLSAANHLGAAGALYFLGHALGDTHSYLDYVCIATVMNTLSAIPLSPGGLGVGEVLAGTLLKMAGGSYTIGVASSITYRLGLFALGLLGGSLLLLPGGAALREGWREAEAEAEREGGSIPAPPGP